MERSGRDERYWTAWLLNVDIVDFSLARPWQQARMVKHLVQRLMGHALMRGRQVDEGYHLNSTGDGFILALPSSEGSDLPLALIDLALDLVDACAELTLAELSMRIRAGIHVGRLRIDRGVHAGGAFAVGEGLNWCTRVASAAGADQVVVSEEFVEHLVEDFGPDILADRVRPAVGADPHEVPVKHQQLARLRLVVPRALPPGRERSLSDRVGSDSRLRENDLIDEHLRTTLRNVAESLVDALHAADPTCDLATVGPRLTLWRPRGEHLRALQIRVLLPEPLGDSLIPPSRTRYRFAGDELDEPQGPVARSWVHRRPEFLLDLPDPLVDRPAYVARMRQEGIPRATVAAFGRDARTWLCLPLRLLDEPSAVLCIDLLRPLVDRAEAEALLDAIAVRSGYLLAALVHMRSG